MHTAGDGGAGDAQADARTGDEPEVNSDEVEEDGRDLDNFIDDEGVGGGRVRVFVRCG